jgi:hypothetical protein
MRRRPLVLAAALLAALLAVPAIAMAANNDETGAATSGPIVQNMLKFDVMSTVTGPYVGATNPIRGLAGGGFPWEVQVAKGEVHPDGTVMVKVRGLTLAHQDPVPPAQQGTNPSPQFKAIVSCQTITAGAPAVVNVETPPAPATTTGDATITGTVKLPSPCIAPIVFVTSPANAWFAATGA